MGCVAMDGSWIVNSVVVCNQILKMWFPLLLQRRLHFREVFHLKIQFLSLLAQPVRLILPAQSFLLEFFFRRIVETSQRDILGG
jgi:hypothetical protein